MGTDLLPLSRGLEEVPPNPTWVEVLRNPLFPSPNIALRGESSKQERSEFSSVSRGRERLAAKYGGLLVKWVRGFGSG